MREAKQLRKIVKCYVNNTTELNLENKIMTDKKQYNRGSEWRKWDLNLFLNEKNVIIN